MTNVAYTHLNTPNNNILYNPKVGGFRLARRRGPRGPISTVSFNWPHRQFIRLGITILGDLMSTAVWEDFPADIAAACKVRAIEAVKASAADQRIDQRAQRSSGAEQLRSAFGKRERRR